MELIIPAFDLMAYFRWESGTIDAAFDLWFSFGGKERFFYSFDNGMLQLLLMLSAFGKVDAFDNYLAPLCLLSSVDTWTLC